MKIVVSGANGLLGSRLCAHLIARGHQVVGLGRGASRIPSPCLSIDLADASAVQSSLKELAPHLVINCAAMTEVDACERDPRAAYTVNCDVAATLATEAKKLGAHMVQVSTDYVFDGREGNYSEDATPRPMGVYAATKYMGELAVKALAGSWAIARVAVVYGWPQAARANFGAWLLETLQKSQPINLFTDQYVTPTLASHAAEMIAELGEEKLSGIWHTCGGASVNRLEFAQALSARFGFDSKLLKPSLLSEARLSSPRPHNSSLNAQKASRELAAKPLGLSAALDRFFLEWKGRVK